MEINPAETSEAPNDAASRERTGEPPNRRGAASGVHTSGELAQLNRRLREQAVELHEALSAAEAAREAAERSAAAVEEAYRELDQFAYVASHDLKAPLRGIANLAEYLQEDLGEQLPPES